MVDKNINTTTTTTTTTNTSSSSVWWFRCDRAFTFLLALYLFFVSQILLTTSMKTMLRFLPQIDSFCTGILDNYNNKIVTTELPESFSTLQKIPEDSVAANHYVDSVGNYVKKTSELMPQKQQHQQRQQPITEKERKRAIDASSTIAMSAATVSTLP